MGNKKLPEEQDSLLNNVGLFVKELNCLYGLAELIAKYNDSPEEVFSGTVSLIPSAWQYPDITCARIIFKDREFKTDDFKITPWKQSAAIRVFNAKVGAIEVYLLEEKPQMAEGPFLAQERKLINALADRVGRTAERKQMEEDLAQAKKTVEDNYKKLRELEDMKDSLTHMIIHDLNNPLATVLGLMYVLKMQFEDKLTEGQKTSLAIAFAAGDGLRRMIGNLLDINKMEEGKIRLRYGYFNLGVIAEEVVGQMQVIARVDEKTVSLEASENIPDVSADKGLITRVIANLVDNAVKYTPVKGSVCVKTLYNRDEKSFYVHVSDTGDGIPTEYLNKIFDKFAQVETKKARTGRGLGLTFCKMAVEAHGGKIWVESEPGKGSIFTFTLPHKE
ncbi:MAG: ATP-binding protein [Candidatus Omnitrophica bacterium]|nr:ATP-binding protein [Candidatus Omnitrophota bacterium]